MAVLRYWDVGSSSYISLSSQGPPGPIGPTGPQGAQGNPGPTGPGVPVGGSTGQLLIKSSATNFDAAWGPVPASDPLAGRVTALENRRVQTYAYAVNGVTQVCAQNVFTQLAFNTVGSGPITNAGVYTAPNIGTYHVTVTVNPPLQAAGQGYQLATFRNGALLEPRGGAVFAANLISPFSFTTLVNCTAGDTLTVNFWNNVASGITLLANTYVVIVQVA